jgi:glucokinase
MNKGRHYLGIDIGGTKCAVLVGTDEGEVLAREEVATASFEPTCEWILTQIEQLSKRYGDSLHGVGISCGGPLDTNEGLVLSPPNLPGWDAVPIVQLANKASQLPTYLMNDANAGALAEGRYGGGRNCDNFAFLTCGTGMGSGIVCNGQILEGSNGFAGEIGHMRLTDDGPIGYGKSGSFEGWCSGGGFAQWAGMSAKEAAKLAHQGDEAALKAFARFGEQLGRGLAVLVDILNPERILIGGIYPRARPWIEPAMLASLEREALSPALSACEVVPAELGECIGDLAAIAVAAYWDEKQ